MRGRDIALLAILSTFSLHDIIHNTAALYLQYGDGGWGLSATTVGDH